MINLPFHIERPFATALVVGIVGIVFAFFWLAYEKNHFRARDILSAYFRRRFGALGPEKAGTAARVFLAGFALLLTCMSVFGFVVAIGIIKNGEKYKPPLAEESQILQEYLGGKDGTIDVKELIRQNEAKRDQDR